MKPKAFEYLRARSVKEVVDALAQHGDDARIIAGGQSLVPMMNFRIAAPALLIDIRHVPELNEIRINGDYVEVGAAVTQNRLLAWDQLQARLPLLAASMPWVGHFQTRNRGTVCGSLAHADPSSEIPLSLAMLEGEVVLASEGGTRTLKASEFQLGMLTTAKEADEMITAARFPIHGGKKVAFREISRRHGDFAMVAVGAMEADSNDILIGIGGVAGSPVVHRFAKGASVAQEVESLLPTMDINDDIHADAEMRQDILRRLAPAVVAELN
jgi:2-furoyl-CoA dehydrogenase FAD binding subunit